MLTGLGPVEKTLRILEEKAERLYTLSSGSSHERSRYVSSRDCRKTLPRSEHDLINHCVVSQSVTSYTPPNSMGRQEDVQYQRGRSLRLCTLLPGTINQTTNSSSISAYDREDLCDIIDTAIEAFPLELLNTEVDETQTLPIRVEGSKEFVAAQLTLLEDYKDIFKSNVNPIAAYIEPFTLVVDESQWGHL